jgi:hypothetical protein
VTKTADSIGTSTGFDSGLIRDSRRSVNSKKETAVIQKMGARRMWIGLLSGMMLCATATGEQLDPGRVAVVNGVAISMQDVEKAAAPEIRSIELRKTQLEIELERDRRLAMDSALEGIVRDRLLAAEAAKRKVSVDELIAIEVDSAVPVPADEVVVQFL